MGDRMGVTYHNLLAWREQARSFAGIEGYEDASLNVTSSDGHEPEQVIAVRATPGFLPLLGITPRLGRNFDVTSANTSVVLITDDLWRSRFSADPHIVGRTMRASDTDYQIVGVLPEHFELPGTGQGFDQSQPKVWMPLVLRAEAKDYAGPALNVVARLKPGVTLDQARAEMRLIAGRLAQEFPDTNRGWGVNVFPTLSEDIDPSLGISLYVLQFAVAFVLLIACANVANLLLTKAVAREREMAVRLAIGATRWRILRQNLTESLVLSAAAGMIGFLLSLVLMRLVTYLAPKDIHGLHELTVNPLVLAFALGVTLLSGLLFGLAPAIHSARQAVAEALNRGSRSVAGSARRFRGALVIVEIALSLILLVGAGLTIRSVIALMTLDQGFRMDHLLIMAITLPSEHYKNSEQIAAFNDQLADRDRFVRQLCSGSARFTRQSAGSFASGLTSSCRSG